MLKYKCLLLDHDDTAVDSTAEIHYPAHVEALRLLRPDHPPPGLEGWYMRNFDPGIMAYLEGELGMSHAELLVELDIWRRYTRSRTPRFYPGFLDMLVEYRAAGGLVAVISHSESDVIDRHYRQARTPPFVPDAVFGWVDEAERRKPSPWPVREALRLFGLSERDALIVDDLKPGVTMSRATGVPVAAAGWSHRIPAIERFMRESCVAYLESVGDLRSMLLD